jgi:5-methyltetrahydropteroyltriglutamate--homocysteine methyltransferase
MQNLFFQKGDKHCMSKVKIFIHGVYPRSGDLAQTTREVDRKRQTSADLTKQQAKDLTELLAVQKKAQVDFFEDGKLTWQDIFRPIVQSTKGFEVGPLTRWFDNNSFYRQPIIVGKLQLNEKKLNEYFGKLPSKESKVTLPSPFFFAKATDDTTSKSFEKTLSAITELYEDILKYLGKKGISFVQFNEPYIPYHKVKKAEIALLGNSLTKLKKVKGKMIFAVHGYFGDVSELVKALSGNSAVDVLGIDFAQTALTSLPKKIKHDIIAGVVDGRNSLLEEQKTISTFVAKAIKYLQPETLYLSNNSELDLLPETVAKEKVALLGKVRKEFVKK